jgi:hypothetical protein
MVESVTARQWQTYIAAQRLEARGAEAIIR